MAVVERRQIDLAIQELVLDRSRPGDSQLQLGKLITADFLVMFEVVPPEKDSPKPCVRLRVVDPKTAAIRGVTVASLDEETMEETVEQFARYVSALIREPEKPTVTVAVAPFESKGRFDRLRPLELGIRDLVTARLLELSGAGSPAPAGQPRQAGPRGAAPVPGAAAVEHGAIAARAGLDPVRVCGQEPVAEGASLARRGVSHSRRRSTNDKTTTSIPSSCAAKWCRL